MGKKGAVIILSILVTASLLLGIVNVGAWEEMVREHDADDYYRDPDADRFATGLVIVVIIFIIIAVIKLYYDNPLPPR